MAPQRFHTQRPTIFLHLLWAATLCHAQHAPLLPAVQKVRYGQAALPVCNLTIGVGATASEADIFAAEQLASSLVVTCGHKLAIQSETHAEPAILFTRTGADEPLPRPDESTGSGSRESYAISVRSNRAEVRAPTSAGLYYAAQTLRQLIELRAGVAALPEVEIEDWPAFAYRGFMMDISHGPVPTEAELRRQIDFLAKWKANQYYLYVEANLELSGYPLLGQIPGLSRDEIRRLIAYARERHIDIVPCVELYGHLHDAFRVENYSRLAALPHGGEVNPLNPQAQALQEDWLRQMTALFPSPWIHLGFDEPWELERAGTAAGKASPDALYLESLKRLSGLATKLGKRPMMWADVTEGAYLFKKYPKLFSELPKGLIAVPWFYARLNDFSPLTEPFARNQVPLIVAPGISNYEEIAPDFVVTFANINGFVASGRRHGALGMINTVWSDSAQMIHRQALPAAAFGAIAAWQNAPVDEAAFFADYCRHAYPAAIAADVAGALSAIAKSQRLLAETIGDETMFRIWDDPLEPDTLSRLRPRRESLRESRLAAEQAQIHLLRAQSLSPQPETIPSLLLAARMLDLANQKYIYALEIADLFARIPAKPSADDVDFYFSRQAASRNHSRIGDLMDLSATLAEEYKAAWLAGYRPYRLEAALGRWRAEYEYWRRLQARFRAAIQAFKTTNRLPTLEELRIGK